MRWHRRRITKLNETLVTERLLLKPAGKFRSIHLQQKMMEDLEILREMTHGSQRTGWLNMVLKRKLPNGRSRFMHEIMVADSGDSIGYHEIRLFPYKSANLSVVILDRSWWGKTVPLEARKVIMAHFARHAGIERFYSVVRSRNFASIFNYKKLGFKHSGTMHRCAFDTVIKEPIDYLEFEMLKEDFPAYMDWGNS